MAGKIRASGGGSFDVVVVGAGSAGCALAARLSEDPSLNVCLIEAGPSDRTGTARVTSRVPAGGAAFRRDTRRNWLFAYAADPTLSGQPIPCPRGKLFGGSSTMNGMIYIRGHRLDYDGWAAAGATGWGWSDVVPFFRGSEDFWRGTDDLHGTGGPLTVSAPRHVHPLSRALIEAAAQCQLPHNDDFNGGAQDGFGLYDLTQKNGERWSSARAFLHPAISRPNLHVLSDVTCEGLRLEGKRAVAVRLTRDGERFEMAASREIVLAAGAIGSPQLLMLSGIGPGAALARHGIAVAHDLPGVGQNLQDHVDNALVYADRTRTAHAGTWRGLMRLGASALGYALRRDGTLASNMVEAGGFLRSRPGLDQPDVQYHFMPLLLDRARILPRDHGFILHAAVLRPKSRGRLELASSDPHAAPVLHAGFYSDAEGEDLATMLRGLRVARQLVAAPAFERYRGAELAPGAAVTSDADLEAYARASVGTVFHPVGTCAIGRGGDAVVAPRLRVHGIEGLRVADASIMPTIVSGNTNAPAIMIGERCADFIRAELRGRMVA